MGKGRKINRVKHNMNAMIILFVCGYSGFELGRSVFFLFGSGNPQGGLLLLPFNLLRLLEFSFSLFVISWNLKYRKKFLILIKTILGCLFCFCFKPDPLG
jgi:hypothetical protein